MASIRIHVYVRKAQLRLSSDACVTNMLPLDINESTQINYDQFNKSDVVFTLIAQLV